MAVVAEDDRVVIVDKIRTPGSDDVSSHMGKHGTAISRHDNYPSVWLVKLDDGTVVFTWNANLRKEE